MRIDTDDTTIYRKLLFKKLGKQWRLCYYCMAHYGLRGGENERRRKVRRNWKRYRKTQWK